MVGNTCIHLAKLCLAGLLFFSSCQDWRTRIRKAPKDRPYVFKTSIEVKGGKFSRVEKTALLERLNNQLDDSATTRSKDVLFIFHILTAPPAYDSAFSGISARNMQASMFHLGYYNALATYKADTSGKKISVKYTVDVGKQTIIDTVTYRLRKPDLQEMALRNVDKAVLLKDNPVTKSAVLSEISRLVDTFRNNGYYKFTAAELKIRGDTTIAALTSLSDDPFEQLALLAEAQLQKDSPKIKLAVVLNQPQDSTKLNQYRLNNLYILQDYVPGDQLSDTTTITQRFTGFNPKSNQRAPVKFILRYHKPYVRTGFLSRNIILRKDSLFKQNDYYTTLANLTRAGIWQSVSIQTVEVKDSNKVDLIFELVPAKKFGFETALEASYSATSNTNNALGGNLFGLSLNFALSNRNIGREAIKMTHALRAGVEFNNNGRTAGTKIINSNELSYTNTVVFPRVLSFRNQESQRRNRYIAGETFINTNLSYTNRLKLFSLQSFNLNYGTLKTKKKGRRVSFRPLNVEFSYLFNQSDSFNKILDANPFLNYSYNTSFVIGMAGGYSSLYQNPKHLLSLSKERSFKFNAEESGLTWGLLPILKKYKKRYLKFDAEYKYTINYVKTALVFRAYAGVGIPLFKDSSLPFFKQYFGGGSNSMRGWPVRGIGRGGQPLAGFSKLFNDRTGDMQLEGNLEYRYDIARIIPNTLTLRGALFIDAGNVWNLKNSAPAGQTDSSQFKFSNLYRQLGVSAGTGFRLDFNYFILRIDLGFRFKRPELSYINNGWKLPPLGFDDVLKKIFTRGPDNVYRRWRYENFNLTVGISYPF